MANKFISHSCFTSTLNYAICTYKGVPNLAYQMLVKIAHTLLLIVNNFANQLLHNHPWEILLKGHQALTFDLNKGLNRAQPTSFYVKC